MYMMAWVANAAFMITTGTAPPYLTQWNALGPAGTPPMIAGQTRPFLYRVGAGASQQQAISFTNNATLYQTQYPYLCRATMTALFAVNFTPGFGGEDQAIAMCAKNAQNYAILRTDNDYQGTDRHLRFRRVVDGVVVADRSTTFRYTEGTRQWVGVEITATKKVKLFWFDANGTFQNEDLSYPGTLPKWTDIGGIVYPGVGATSGIGPLQGGIEAVAMGASHLSAANITSDKVYIEGFLSGTN